MSAPATIPALRDLRFLGWRGLDKPDVTHAFLKPRGRGLRSDYVTNGSNLVRLLGQDASHGVDIVTPSTDFGPRSQAELHPYLAPLNLDRIPNLGSLFEGFRTGPWNPSAAPLHTVPLLWGDSPVVYDPRQIDGVPASYVDLAKPEWKGKVVIRNEMYCVLWMFSSALGHPDPARITLAELAEVRRLARAIKENTVRVAGSYREMTEMLIAREAAISVSGWQLMCHWAGTEHDVELRFDTPGNDRKYWWIDMYAILASSDEQDASHELLNHVLSPQANASLAWEMQSCPVNAESYPLLPDGLASLYDTSLVSGGDPGNGPLTKAVSALPPLEREGDIAGDADWQAVWLDFLLS
jgi:spermidine/putrescine-binding protein